MILLNSIQTYKKIVQQIQGPIGFVLGEYITGGLGAVRCLGRAGVPVIWLDATSKHIGFHSKYCKGIISPDLRDHPRDYIDFLLDIGSSLSYKGVLFPIRDIEVMTMLKHRSQLEKYFHIPMADLSISKKLLNKYIFYKTLKNYNIPHAKTFFSHKLSDIEDISKKVQYPCILKPFHSANFVLEFGKKMFIANSAIQLQQQYQKALAKKHEVLIQEIIPGSAQNMCGMNAYYDKTFIPHGVFMYQRIREWPHGMGNGCCIESVKIPELEKIITPFMKNIKYYGIVDAEFKMDSRDHKYKLIEINSRCWMQSSLPARCGANIPLLAYLDAVGRDMGTPTEIKDHLKWVFMGEDIRSGLKSFLKKDLSLADWIRSYKGTMEFSILASDDLVPFFYSLLPIYHK
ncbi:MAG: hypothetical protein KKG04_09080 [Candidatus Thermoplasmatota archaeon]|nr:hypothetical protein [Candidatus Thermoplasmatota archaeon]